MLLAADLCFLYLHVSQNTALYRNTEKRLQQKSSRTESFVFVAHMNIGLSFAMRHMVSQGSVPGQRHRTLLFGTRNQ